MKKADQRDILEGAREAKRAYARTRKERDELEAKAVAEAEATYPGADVGKVQFYGTPPEVYVPIRQPGESAHTIYAWLP